MCNFYKSSLLLLNFPMFSAATPPLSSRFSILVPSSTLQQSLATQVNRVPTPPARVRITNNSTKLSKTLGPRATTSETSTCGYYTGDPTKPRTANDGFDCRIDSTRRLWGFCPTTVINAADCGLAGACVDSAACSTGCGVTGNPTMTTFTCSETNAKFCSTVLLGQLDQTFSYIACGAQAKTDILQASTTADGVKTSTSLTTDGSGAPNTPTSANALPTSGSSVIISSASLATTASISSQVITSSVLPPSAPSETNSTTSNSTGTSSNTGAIIGGALGGLALICITVTGVVFIFRRGTQRRLKSREIPAENSGEVPNKNINQYESPRRSFTSRMNDIQKYPVEMDAEREGDESAMHSLPSRVVLELP